jgi:hypothetical protein
MAPWDTVRQNPSGGKAFSPNKALQEEPKDTVLPARKPAVYTEELALEVCARMAEGVPVTKVCKLKGMPSVSAFLYWLAALNDEGQPANPVLVEQYTRAREIQQEVLFAQIVELSDTVRIGIKTKRKTIPATKEGEKATVEETRETGDMVDRARLQIDARKWVLGKMAPKKYGADRLALRLVDENDKDRPFNLADVDRIIQEAEAEGD